MVEKLPARAIPAVKIVEGVAEPPERHRKLAARKADACLEQQAIIFVESQAIGGRVKTAIPVHVARPQAEPHSEYRRCFAAFKRFRRVDFRVIARWKNGKRIWPDETHRIITESVDFHAVNALRFEIVP